MTAAPPRVQLDAEPNGLAEMLAGLIEGNLEREPTRAALLVAPLVASFAASDAEVAVTVRIGRGGAVVENGGSPSATLRVRADSADLIGLVAAPLRLGLPDPLAPEGRAVIGKLLRGRIRVGGLQRHPALVSRLARILSAR